MADVTSALLAVPSELEVSGSTILSRATQIELELQALKNKLAPMMAAWTGAAQAYYQGLQQEWDVAAYGLFGPGGVLGQIAAGMNQNWNNYVDCEWSNTRTWQ